MKNFPEYEDYDGLGLAELVRKREIKPIELVEEAITRIERLNPELNAVIYKMYDLARGAAESDLPDGSFKGVPFLLKDIYAGYAGVPMQSGSRFHRDFVPDHDGEMVKRFKAAGLVVLGKTNLPEYGLLPVTEPSAFGPTRNPWDRDRTPGGSSGGSAAAVAARMVPMAHGNDGGGSIRIPASCCGLFGLKPSRARNPLGPDIAEGWHGMVCDHVLTRSVRDSAAMLDATAGPDTGAPYHAPPAPGSYLEMTRQEPVDLKIHIAFTSRPLLTGIVHKEVLEGFDATLKLLDSLGHELVEAAPEMDGEAFASAFLNVVYAETRAGIEEAEAAMGRKARFTEFEPGTWAAGLLGKRISAAEFCRAFHFLQRSARRISTFFEKYDVLLTPTLAMEPVLTGELQPKGTVDTALRFTGRLNAGWLLTRLADIDALARELFRFIPYTPVFNVTGQPAMSVPLHWSSRGLPIGMHFAGRYGDEATLFRLARQLEIAAPWFDRKPPESNHLSVSAEAGAA